MRQSAGGVEFVRTEEWIRSEAYGGRALAYAVRNSHLASRLRDAAGELPIAFEERVAWSIDDCRALAPGVRPLIVNATTRSLISSGASKVEAAPRSFVLASQLPFAASRREERGILPHSAGFFSTLLREGHLDMGIFSPLFDPLSPSADFYGIVFRIVRANPGFDPEREFGSLYAELIEIGDALGFEPIDVEATEGRAMVPCTPWNCAGNLGGSVLELSSIYHAGSPIITGDGMTRAGIAALVAAEAVIAGEDPAYHANRAPARWKAANRGLTYAMTGFARLMAVMMRLSPSRALSVADQPDFWAGVE